MRTSAEPTKKYAAEIRWQGLNLATLPNLGQMINEPMVSPPQARGHNAAVRDNVKERKNQVLW